MSGVAKEVPWCTAFLVVGALSAHVLVLSGNLATAGMLHNLGESTHGWSQVGLSLASAMQNQLDPAMSNVSYYLTETIDVITELQQSTDVMLSMSGSATDAALAEYNVTRDDSEEFKAKVMASLREVSTKLLDQIVPLVDKLLALLQPALNQLQEWMTSFGTKAQPAIQEFTSTLDQAQTLFDQVMTQMGTSSGTNEDTMIYNTYTLFDTDGSGTLYPNDLQNVAQLFGISALSGNKAKEVFDTYDTNGQGGIDQEEYALFVHDPSLPGVMSTVLRTYSKTLAEIGGRMSGARMRDEVAIEVAGYLEVVSSKNITRLSWVSQALTNGSLPIQFTADVLRELAVAVDDPNRLSVVDVGAVVFGEMMRLNSEWLVKAVRLLSEPQFWLSEGFPGPEEAGVVSRLVNWTATTPLGPWALKQGGMDFRDSASNGESLAKAAYRVIQGRQSHYAAGHLVDKASGEATVYSSSASQYMRSQLLGGSGAAASGDNLEADMATRAGVPALPATLQFAHWLANNATLTAQQHLQECFDYSGESSGTLDSLAVQVNGMFSKVQGFMNQMSSYATSQGVERLVNQSLSFLKGAADDIVLVCEEYVDAQLAEINCQLSGVVCNMTAREKDMSLDLTGSFNFITMTLQDLKTVMPAVLKDLKFAKKGVSSVSNSMNSVMVVLGLKAPPFMYQISLLYRRLWVAYFVVFGLMTLGVLFYAFWASGYFGGPQTQTSSAGEDGGYEAPRGFAERLRSCCTSCTACVRGCHDNHLCFWSLLLLAEVVVLLLFLVSVVICIIGGVQAFLSVGCAQVYILGNESICTTALKVMRTFLSTFWMQSSSVQDTCVQESLLTCQLMTNHMNAVVKLSVFGSLLASVLSFWMVLESALMHERARWSRVVDAQAKKP